MKITIEPFSGQSGQRWRATAQSKDLPKGNGICGHGTADGAWVAGYGDEPNEALNNVYRLIGHAFCDQFARRG